VQENILEPTHIIAGDFLGQTHATEQFYQLIRDGNRPQISNWDCMYPLRDIANNDQQVALIGKYPTITSIDMSSILLNKHRGGMGSDAQLAFVGQGG